MLKYFSVLLGKIANEYVEVLGDCLLEGESLLSMTRSSILRSFFTRRKF